MDPIADAPTELIEFLENAASLQDPSLRIHVLSLEESREESEAMQQTPLGEALGVVVLDDAEDSNPYCYVTRGIAKGMILHFSHDSEPRLRYPNLDEFREALATAIDNGVDIDDLPSEELPPHGDQRRLGQAIRSLLEGEDGVDEELLTLFISLVDPNEVELLQEVAAYDSFFVRESVGEFIAAHPAPPLLPIASTLASDRHPQAAAAGKKARSAIERELRR